MKYLGFPATFNFFSDSVHSTCKVYCYLNTSVLNCTVSHRRTRTPRWRGSTRARRASSSPTQHSLVWHWLSWQGFGLDAHSSNQTSWPKFGLAAPSPTPPSWQEFGLAAPSPTPPIAGKSLVWLHPLLTCLAGQGLVWLHPLLTCLAGQALVWLHPLLFNLAGLCLVGLICLCPHSPCDFNVPSVDKATVFKAFFIILPFLFSKVITAFNVPCDV